MQSYVYCTAHGSGGGGLTGSGVNRAERFATGVLEGVDIFASAHVHRGVITKPSKVVVDPTHNIITQKTITVVSACSWLSYGGYAPWYVVRNTRGVTGFVGPGSKPVPLTEQEVRNMGVNRENEEFEFVEGETVTVLNGAWINTQGVIKAINAAKQTLTITVEMFGRETPVEIAFEDVKVEHY